MSTLASLKLGLVAVALAASALAGCGGPEARDAASVRFAVSSETAIAATGSVRVLNTHVLSKHVDFRQPLDVKKAGKDVEVSFGVRQREGATYRLEKDLMQTKSITPFTFEKRLGGDASYYLGGDTAQIALEDGRAMQVFTDARSGRVVAQIDGAEMPISPDAAIAIGPPRAVAVDAQHVVVAYFATTELGCALVVSNVEVAQ